MPKRIFITDDGKTIRRFVRTDLESRLEYIVCADATDSVGSIRGAGEVEPDLIVLDLSLPMMNGLAVAHPLHDMLSMVSNCL